MPTPTTYVNCTPYHKTPPIASITERNQCSPQNWIRNTDRTMGPKGLDAGNASETVPSRGFRMLYRKVFPHPARPNLTAWSPRLDLFATVMDNGNVMLFRMNGQRVWSIAKKHDTTVEQLQWRPDGRARRPLVGEKEGEASMNCLTNAFFKGKCCL